jgi:hypothetical protein
MSEIARFRIARAPERRLLDEADKVPIHGKRTEPTEFVASIVAALALSDPPQRDPKSYDDKIAAAVKLVAQKYVNSPEFVDPSLLAAEGSAVREVQRLDRWLVSQEAEPTPMGFRTQLPVAAAAMHLDGVTLEGAATSIVNSEPWGVARTRLGDSLVAALLAGSDRKRLPMNAQRLTRLVLVAALLEVFAERAADDFTDVLELQRLLQRTPLLPSPPFPLVKYLPTRSLLARTPTFSDLYVVRDEWSCYLPGEIAHIENVLRGELMERRHRRTDETETTETRQTDLAKIDERDLQSTDRTSLKEETAHDTSLSIGVEGQLDTSGQYGPTHVETHLGGSVEYSVSDSRKRATEQAKETVQRAVSRVESRVQEARTVRTLLRIEESSRHLIDNAHDPEGNVVGVYRWVDKVQRFQVFRYPHRYLLEFEIPEPAALVRWIRTKKKAGAADNVS